MKSTIRISAIATVCLLLPVSNAQKVIAQTCSDQSQPLIIYRNAGPPIIIENGFNPCKEAEKKAHKLQRKREKLARKHEERQEEREVKIDLRP